MAVIYFAGMVADHVRIKSLAMRTFLSTNLKGGVNDSAKKKKDAFFDLPNNIAWCQRKGTYITETFFLRMNCDHVTPGFVDVGKLLATNLNG